MTLPANIRVNVGVPFPALVIGSSFITLGKVNGTWVVGANGDLVGAQTPGQSPTDFALVWDSIAKAFTKVSLSDLVTPPINVQAFGAVGDGVKDDTAAIQRALDSLNNTYSGRVQVPKGSLISNTLSWRNSSIRLEGVGWGNSSSPNKASYLKWNGPAGIPMISVSNSWGSAIKSLRLIGNVTNPPSDMIKFTQDATPGFGNFPWTSTGAVNTAQKLALEDLWIGTMFGTDPVTDALGQFTNGITYAGTANMDNCSIRNVTISGALQRAIDCSNPQGGLLTMHGLQLNFNNVGIRTFCRIIGTNINFEASTTLDIEIADGGWVYLRSAASEAAPKHVKFTGASGRYTLKESTLQITSNILVGDPKFFDASSGANPHLTSIDLENVRFDPSTPPGAPPLISAKNQNGGTTLGYLRVAGCDGIGPENIDIGSCVFTNDGRTFIYEPSPMTATPVMPRDELTLDFNIAADQTRETWRRDFLGKVNTFGGPLNVRALHAPVAVTATNSLGSGATIYTYQVVAKTRDGTTGASSAATCTNAASLGANNKNKITWNQCTGAYAYDIYGRIGGSIGFLATVTWDSLFTGGTFAGFSYTDSGTPAPGAAAPTQNTTGNGVIEGALTMSNLIAVGTPTNANAATAGVAVGQFYRDTADPSKIYVRTV